MLYFPFPTQLPPRKGGSHKGSRESGSPVGEEPGCGRQHRHLRLWGWAAAALSCCVSAAQLLPARGPAGLWSGLPLSTALTPESHHAPPLAPRPVEDLSHPRRLSLGLSPLLVLSFIKGASRGRGGRKTEGLAVLGPLINTGVNTDCSTFHLSSELLNR